MVQDLAMYELDIICRTSLGRNGIFVFKPYNAIFNCLLNGSYNRK